MKTVLAATFAVFLFANTGPSFATEADQASDQSAMDETVPSAAASGDGEAEAKPPANPASPGNDDLMQNFTRHRPGACPEGPPCKVED